MKKIFTSLSLILVIATMSSYQVLASDPINISIAKLKQEDRDVKNFTSVAAGGPIHVIITLGNTEGLKFEGDADAIATLITEVKGSTLIIRPQTSWTSWAKKYENKKITAYVNAKTIKSLTMSGNGSLSVIGKIKETSFTATLSGSGSITANTVVNDFTGVISGSGNLNFTGSANDATITLSGSGSFTKKGFTTDNLSAVVSGSGSVNMTVENSLDAVISGSGMINYSGNPKVEQRVIGSGKVRKI